MKSSDFNKLNKKLWMINWFYFTGHWIENMLSYIFKSDILIAYLNQSIFEQKIYIKKNVGECKSKLV